MTQQAFRIILGMLIASAWAQFTLAKAQRIGPIKTAKTHCTGPMLKVTELIKSSFLITLANHHFEVVF